MVGLSWELNSQEGVGVKNSGSAVQQMWLRISTLILSKAEISSKPQSLLSSLVGEQNDFINLMGIEMT